LASAGLPPGGAIPGQYPSALTRSSEVTGLSGVSGGASIEMFRMNSLPGRENQSASFNSDAPEQPAMTGASRSSGSSRFRAALLSRTMN
jgi:hypothetical protein